MFYSSIKLILLNHLNIFQNPDKNAKEFKFEVENKKKIVFTEMNQWHYICFTQFHTNEVAYILGIWSELASIVIRYIYIPGRLKKKFRLMVNIVWAFEIPQFLALLMLFWEYSVVGMNTNLIWIPSWARTVTVVLVCLDWEIASL